MHARTKCKNQSYLEELEPGTTGQQVQHSAMLPSSSRTDINPLHHKINMHNLHTVFFTFPYLLTKRISLPIGKSLVGDHFLYSHDRSVCFRGDVEKRN